VTECDVVLLYLSYGPARIHRENRFSALTALHQLRGDAGRARVVVYTDDASAFADLPVTVRTLGRAELEEWSGGGRSYNNRAKTRAMVDAFERYGRPLVYLDGDTWVRRPLHRLVSRIRPGQAVMHLPEGRLLEVPDRRRARLAAHLEGAAFQLGSGAPFSIPADAVMWNSGVVGLHPRDAHLLEDAGSLAQQLWDALPGQPHLEQFALGQVLGQHLRLRAAEADVFHYWMAHLRDPFQQRLPALLDSVAGLPVPEQARVCYAARPRPVGLGRVKVAAKRTMRAAGLPTARIRSSA
jgi:hypothetical protein